jgi:ATP-dependent exoDNAse (exonuclease V) beta subunit
VELLRPQLERALLVGDGEQSIYRFRGAGVSLKQLALEKTGAAPLRLSISRRPTEQSLAAYNALFRATSAGYPELGDPLCPHDGTLQANNKLPPITLLNAGERDDPAAPAASRRGSRPLFPSDQA